MGRARETVEALRGQLAEMEAAFRAETETLGGGGDALARPLDTVSVRPTKQEYFRDARDLAWAPAWRDGAGQLTPAWR